MNRVSGLRGWSGALLASLLIVTFQAACAGGSEQTPSKSSYDLGFKVPNLSKAQEDAILAKYQYLDPKRIVPTDLLREAIIYYDVNLSNISNKNALAIVDYSRYSGRKRLFVVDMRTGSVSAYHVAHGLGSDPDTKAHPFGTGYARRFSNVVNSEESSLGFYLAEEIYTGTDGLSLALDGLSDTNSNARVREIVLHGAPYVTEADVRQGRSFGCFAVALSVRDQIIKQLGGGALLYAGVAGATSVDNNRQAYPPLWENGEPARRRWTADAFNAVETYASDLIRGSSDMPNFCPKYARLDPDQKISFWVYLVSSVAKYESGFNPDSRYKETTLGKDPITGEPVYSEGLLQLSYQDVLKYPFCNQFDWEKDKKLKPTSPKKTIFDVGKNLTCGIRILNQQVRENHLIAFRKDQYWSTLMPGNRHNRIAAIQKLTSAIPFCH